MPESSCLAPFHCNCLALSFPLDSSHPDSRVAVLSPGISTKDQGRPATSSPWERAQVYIRRLWATPSLGHGPRDSPGLARCLGQGSPKPSGSGGRSGARVLAKGLPLGGPSPAQGGALEVPPQGDESGAQLRPRGHGGGQAAGPPAGTFLRPRPAPSLPRRRLPRWKAARRVRTDALAARPVGSPGRVGSGNVGRRRAAHPPGPPLAPPPPRGQGAPRSPSNEPRR